MPVAWNVILDILNDQKHHQARANQSAASVILRVTYGQSTHTATNAPRIVMTHKTLKLFQMLMRPGALLIERYPILKYAPFYASYLETWRQEESKLLQNTGETGPSLARYLLENQDTQTSVRRNGVPCGFSLWCWFRHGAYS